MSIVENQIIENSDSRKAMVGADIMGSLMLALIPCSKKSKY